MQIDLHIFGYNEGTYWQIPSDGFKEMLRNLTRNISKGSFLIVYRQQTLIHYIYYRVFNSSHSINSFAFVFTTNGLIIDNLTSVYKCLDMSMNRVITQGTILTLDKDGNIRYKFNNFGVNSELTTTLLLTVKNDIDNNLNSKGKYFKENFSGKNEKKELTINSSISVQHDAIINYQTVYLDATESGSDIDYISLLIKKQHQEYSDLKTKYEVLNRKKKQYKYVVSLFLIVVLCLVGLYLFYNEVIHKNDQIVKLEKTILVKNDSISSKNKKIENLDNEVTSLNAKLERLGEYTSTTGSTLRNNDSSDNGWIMWLHAKSTVKMESFFVKGGSSSNGEMTLALYDSADNLIATVDAYVSSSEFKKIYLGDDWILKSGYYYLRIKEPNGRSLQYHGSNDKEYTQFSGGALEVTGCCSYGDRNKDENRNKHSYYQYFYNIQYKIRTN